MGGASSTLTDGAQLENVDSDHRGAHAHPVTWNQGDGSLLVRVVATQSILREPLGGYGASLLRVHGGKAPEDDTVRAIARLMRSRPCVPCLLHDPPFPPLSPFTAVDDLQRLRQEHAALFDQLTQATVHGAALQRLVQQRESEVCNWGTRGGSSAEASRL